MKRRTFPIKLPVWCALTFLFGTSGAYAQLPALYQPPTLAQAADRAHQLFDESRLHWLCQTNNAESACKFGHACFDWAEFAAGASQRVAIAREGIAACRCATQLKPQLGAAHYYFAMNLGQIAETRPLGVLKLVRDMEAEFKTAADLDPAFDYAGPWRSLGELYRDAPGPPFSIGNHVKARDYLNKAVALRPDYPANQIGLLEACLKLGERNTVKLRLPDVERILHEAREQLTGVEWAQFWQDWEIRWDKLQRRMGAVTAKK